MEHDKRLVVYPCYLNSNFSVAQGRKIPKSAACADPTAVEIYDSVVHGLKLPAEAERKQHPKDWRYIGRIRVQLRDASGNLINPQISSRRELLLKIAELVLRHPDRTGKSKVTSSSAGASGSKGTSTGSSGKKKK